MNAPVVPKARMKVDEFLAWSERQPEGSAVWIRRGIIGESSCVFGSAGRCH